jgi:hypothetical protein
MNKRVFTVPATNIQTTHNLCNMQHVNKLVSELDFQSKQGDRKWPATVQR